MDKKHITISKLGYKPVNMVLPITDSVLCLDEQPNELPEVTVDTNGIDLYNYLIELRDKSKIDFLDYDSTILYAFQYRSRLLNDSTLLESATGFSKVDYRDGYNYPLKFASFKGEQITYIRYLYDSSRLTETEFQHIKYPTMGILVGAHNLMETKPGFDWVKIKNLKETIQLFHDSMGNKAFVTSYEGNVTRKFYFDPEDKIDKIEFYKPVVFYKSNFDYTQCQYKATVHYRKTLPRIADSFEMEYTVHSTSRPYHIYLLVTLADSSSVRFKYESAKPGDMAYDGFLSNASEFHNIWKKLDSAIKKKFIKVMDTGAQ
ncbi:MAG: hypothetical protein QM642_05905 [Edaphocola sp.]